MVSLERRLRGEQVDELKAGFRTKSHGKRGGTIQLHHWGWHQLGESIVERGDALPVRFRRGTRASVTCGDGGLKCGVGAERATELFGSPQSGEAATDQNVIPTRAILIEKQDRLSRRDPTRA